MVNNSNGFPFNARITVHLSMATVLLTQVNKVKSESTHRCTQIYIYIYIKTDQKSQDI